MKQCSDCSKYCSWILLLLGLGFLSQDQGWWPFFNLSWYTAVFLMMGLCGVFSGMCRKCK